MAVSVILLASAAAVATSVVVARNAMARSRRELYIRGYMFPRGLFDNLAKARPELDVKHQQLVARALRQFFLAFLKSGGKRVAMPSQVVDDLWHEFILFTRDYQQFCERAFGQFLHHTPAVKLGDAPADNEGLRRVWWYTCLEENINPRKATRLPLLFALDQKLNIANGFFYDLDCRRTQGGEGPADGQRQRLCATDFSNPAVGGTTAGMGGCASGGGGSDAAPDGGTSGCSGGCSGGCGGGS